MGQITDLLPSYVRTGVANMNHKLRIEVVVEQFSYWELVLEGLSIDRIGLLGDRISPQLEPGLQRKSFFLGDQL